MSHPDTVHSPFKKSSFDLIADESLCSALWENQLQNVPNATGVPAPVDGSVQPAVPAQVVDLSKNAQVHSRVRP